MLKGEILQNYILFGCDGNSNVRRSVVEVNISRSQKQRIPTLLHGIGDVGRLDTEKHRLKMRGKERGRER